MQKMNHIHEELKQISPSVATIEKFNVYSVSNAYFDNLANEIVEKIRLEVEPVYFFSNVTPYKVPVSYFENLAGAILEKVADKENIRSEVFEEMEKISPLLNTINKKQVFSLPAGYFEGVNAKDPVETVKEEAKVVSIKSTPHRFIKYAVAAVITSILAVGLFIFTGKDAGTSRAVTNSTSVDVKNLSEDEIVEFLKKSASYEVSATENTYKKESDIERAVEEMTDKEIQQFLQENAVSDEI